MSNVAARQPAGRERIKESVLSKEPQVVGKSSEFIPWLTDVTFGLFQEYDMS
jgi:hypothetical protein